jgi:hypothetical protein
MQPANQLAGSFNRRWQIARCMVQSLKISSLSPYSLPKRKPPCLSSPVRTRNQRMLLSVLSRISSLDPPPSMLLDLIVWYRLIKLAWSNMSFGRNNIYRCVSHVPTSPSLACPHCSSLMSLLHEPHQPPLGETLLAATSLGFEASSTSVTSSDDRQLQQHGTSFKALTTTTGSTTNVAHITVVCSLWQRYLPMGAPPLTSCSTDNHHW